MSTYLIKNRIAHFLSNDVVSNPLPQTYELYYFNGKHSLEMVSNGIVDKVCDIPFKLNKEFILNGDMANEFNLSQNE